MANKVIFEVIATSEGFEIVQKQQDKLRKSVDKTTQSHKKLDNQQKVTYGRQEQGLVQTANGTKNFSKLASSIGNDRSGLVGAYAALAANIFAATAAFNALRSAAQVDTLIQGFTFLGNAAGKTSLQIAEGLREVTDEAISLEEALRASAIAVTSGFNTDQIQRLGEVARNASVALGRNLGDSIDRLFRGVAKLEPEILDELGILVRLDTAVEEYGASIGKAGSELTDFERRQAFLNATITQGALKYGALTSAIEPNAYDKLAAAFQDLTREGLKLINTFFTPLLNLLSGSSSAMIGGLVLFGTTILTQIIPALGQLAQRQAEVAATAKYMADQEANANKQAAQRAKIDLVRGSAAKTKAGGEFSSVSALQKSLKRGTAEAGEFEKAIKQVQRAQRDTQRRAKEAGKENTKAHLKRMRELEALEQQIYDVQKAEQARSSTRGTSAFLTSKASAQGALVGDLELIQGAGAFEGFKLATKSFKEYRTEIDKGFKESSIMSKGFFSKFGLNAQKGFSLASGGVRVFGAALLNAIPVIGQILFFGGLLIQFLKNTFDSTTEVDKAFKNLQETTGTVEEKLSQLVKTNSEIETRLIRSGTEIRANTVATIQQGNQLKVTAGILSEFGGNLNLYLNELAASTEETNILSGALGKLGDAFSYGAEAAKQAANNIADAFLNNPKIAGVIKILEILKGKTLDAFNLSENDLKLEKAAREVENQIDALITNLEKGGMKEFAAELKAEFDKADLPKVFRDAAKANKEFGATADTVKKIYNDITGGTTSASAAAENISKQFGEFTKQVSKNKKALKEENTYDQLETTIGSVAKDLDTLVKSGKLTDIGEFLRQNIGADALKDFGISFKELKDQIAAGENPFKDLEKIFNKLADATRENKRQVKLLNAEISADKALNAYNEALINTKLAFENFKKTGKFEIAAADKTQAALEASDRARTAEENLLKKKLDLIDKEFELELLKLSLFAKSDEDLKKVQTLVNEIKGLKQDETVLSSLTTQAGYDKADLTALASAGTSGSFIDRISDVGTALDNTNNTVAGRIENIRNAMSPLFDDLKKLGAEGELAAAVGQGALTIVDSFNLIAEAGLNSAEGLAAVGTAITSIGAIIQAQAKAQMAQIESQIELEKKRDGKSAESVARIKQLEAKKEAIAKKAFERNKKMQIASAVANTAAGIVAALGDPGNTGQPSPMRIAFASLIGAMGLAQIAIIRKQQYQGSSGGNEMPSNTSLTIGGRSSAVDVAKGATSGELSYLRGARMRGNENIGGAGSSFPGSAMGRRGYADGAMLVGERGPEVVAPSGQVDVIPNYALGGGNTNVNFTINAVDGASVENMLYTQRGNIIGMIREAANANGEGFLESVDPAVYGGGG